MQETMKKIYMAPDTEIVNVKLISSVMDPDDVDIFHSQYAVDPLAKENDLVFDDDAWDSDPWSEGGDNTNPYDLWGE